ncbi:MAG: ABC transporter substrate-binding protein [Lachnospiraceae bacterium]|nr:ABC transporter substrate-binding protein [Lachnospiraceae bacterium]
MKKKMTALLMAMVLIFSIGGCGKKEAAPAEMNLAVMTGPTAIGLVKVMSDMEAGTAKNEYNFSVYGTGDEIATELLKGNLDAACVPCNLAAVLYSKSGGEIVTAAINTLGVLYIVETGDAIQRVEDLRGKTIYSTGQGTTPEFTLRYLLSSSGIDPDQDVTIEYKSEASEVAAMLAEATDAVAMLPQPYVTAAMNQNASLRIALSVTEEWEKLNEDSTVVTGVLVARKSYIEENEEAFRVFLEEYEASAAYANEHVEETAAGLEYFNIFKAAIAKKAIPYCNVTYIDGTDMKEKMQAYLQVLFDQKAAAVGGAMPGDDFYYRAE